MQLAIEPLTRDAFAPFGDVIEAAADHLSFPINAGTSQRFHDLARLDPGEGGRLIVSIFRAQPRRLPLAITMLERHPKASQAFMPLAGRPFLVVVAPNRAQEALWAAEHALASGVFGAVLYWKSGIDARQVRRLQVATAGHDTLACLLRPAREQTESSPASLRLSLTAGTQDTLDVRLLKRRGPPCNRTLHLAVPRPLNRPLRLHEADEPRFPQDIQSAIPLARPASALPFARSQRPAAVA